MKKYLLFIVFLLIVIVLAGFGIYHFRSALPKLAWPQSNGAVWKYTKTIASPITATSKADSDITMGDLTTNKVSIVIPKGSFDNDTSVELKTPDSVPHYPQAEMTPLGTPIEISAGAKPVRLNQPMPGKIICL